MPNILDANGLQTMTRDEWVAYYTNQYQTIYGPDVNLGSNTPDGQMMNNNIQVALDLQDLTVQVYNSFDPDNAVGVVLDQRIAINGIQRQAGTYTVTNITVVTSQSVNLYGLDQTAQPVYTISDNAGNLWVLQETQLGVSSGTHVYSFQSAVPGTVLTIPNTINVPVTIVLGVTSVNNPTTYTSLGLAQETDVAAKLRRQKSVSLASQGYLAGLLAALENISGVTAAFVYENNTSTTDGDGVPGHSIWVIVSGTGAAASIAQAIYTKRNAGCGMYGTTTYTITQVDGTPFVIKWDTTVTQNVFIKFTATSINGIQAPNYQQIRTLLPSMYVPGVNEEVNINALGTYVQEIDTNTLVTNSGFSNGETQQFTFSGTAASGAMAVSYNGNTSASIAYNDSTATIQTKVRAISGLSSVVVTGSITSGPLNFDLSSVGDVLGLLAVATNTLMTSAPAAVTVSYTSTFSPILYPSTKRNQFVISSDNIVILPMLLSPATSSVAASTSENFAGYGGYGAYTYSISVNNSGGSINATTGVYTAGSTASVNDTILVTDKWQNTATATVSVV